MELLICQLLVRLSTHLVSGHYTEVCDGIVVSLDQTPLEGQVALTPPTLVEVGRLATNREGQSFMPH